MISEIGYLILGIILLFIPGFLLSFLLFGGRDALGIGERILTSVGLSAFIDMLIITVLAQPSIKALQLAPVIGGIAAFCAAAGVILFLREESRKTFYEFWNPTNTDS